MNRKTLLSMSVKLGAFSILFMVIASFVNAQEAAANKTPCIGHHPWESPAQNKDDEITPRVLYETEPVAQGSRKGRKYVAPGWISAADGTNDSGDVISTDERPVADIPAEVSSIILIGMVTDANAYLVNNKTGIYSEYTFLTESVLKNNTGLMLNAGSKISGTRDGGVVQFSSGKCVRDRVSGKGSLELKGKYLVFLRKEAEGDFEIITAYLLKDGAVYPLDGSRLYLSGFGGTPYDKHTDQNIQTFLDEVRAAIGSD